WWIYRSPQGETHTETFSGHTDPSGKHNLRIDLDSADPPRPYNLTAQATVFDVNRQGWAASASLLIHPADLYVGVRSPRTFVQKGEPLIVQSIVTDLDGNAVSGRQISLHSVRLDWEFRKGQWTQKEVDPQDCTIASSSDAVQCKFDTKEGGEYKITATIADDRGRKNQSSLTLWVAGGKLPPKRNLEQEQATLIPDRKDYQPGDTAEILVQSPWARAEGVLTLRRSGLVSSQTFKMDGPSTTLKIPIQEGYIPNLDVQVDLVGAAERDPSAAADGKTIAERPAFASGSLTLSVPPRARTLTVTAVPRDTKLEPGGETSIAVQVHDASGSPVAGSEVAVVVVDEAILALTTYKLEDPVAAFYTTRPGGVSDYRSRNDVVLGNTEDLVKPTTGGGGGGGRAIRLNSPARMMKAPPPPPSPAMQGVPGGISGGIPGQGPAIRVRENFNPLATFAASVPTDANGAATVQVKLPDNLTRYRIMAVSVAGAKQFGSGESAITARLPLMVRPSAPRFLNFGDRFELPVVVQNQTDSPMEVNVAVRAANAELTGGAGRTVTVPANDRVEVRFPTAAERAGTARFQVAATSGNWADAAQFELPVWTPATTEAFATYGEIDQGAIAQPVLAPADAVKQFGGLEISTSSTELQSLTDAVLYLQRYPFECSEQISSRVLAIAALRDVLSAFEAKGLPKPEELAKTVDSDIARLKVMQNSDGGFGFWRRGDEPWPYLGIHVAHALERAKLKGFQVPADVLSKSQSYLRAIDQKIPSYYPDSSRRALIAYALFVRNLMGDRDAARARQLIAEAGLNGLSMESIGWLLPVLSGDSGSQDQVAAIRKYLNNRVEEEAGTAHFTSSYADGEHLLLHSNRRDDGVILDALIGDQPNSDLIPKIVRGLLAHRTEGRWNNTQENVFILLALDRYFNVYEKTTPNFTARAWLDDAYAGGHDFKGRTTERTYLNIPMMYLMQTASAKKLVLSKDGQGRLYYRIGMQYAPANLNLKPADYGFTVQRVYEAVDNPNDVRRDADGTWHIKAGASVRVRLTMVAPARRYHVALVDPIPAGLEPLNPALAVTGSIPQDPKTTTQTTRWWWWLRPWFEHQNMRDERVEAFASLLWDGVYDYTYVARATTPGSFIVPPPKAEEMYHPETFGRGGTDRVVVE
ncbi:MAG TPA: alpha-2-macroglobulin family protein, partial [Blastocatellia bacterium]|nr:alpha-2-macroglobulin family protein [Blastocatellia bacterium]